MCARAPRGTVQVAAKDRCAGVDLHLLQQYRLAVAMAQDDPSVCGGADTIARSNDSFFRSVFCPLSSKAHLNGGSGKDDLEGTFGHDLLLGGSGSDELRGQNGSDVLQGGPGNDRLVGGLGPDKLRGQAGNDRLYGNQDRDHADGGSGRKDLCRTERQRQCER